MDEMQAIQKNLSSGQQEKQDLMQVGDRGRGGQKLSGLDTGYNISKARQIMDEMQAIQKNLSSGQQEKQDLMQVGDRGRGGRSCQVLILAIISGRLDR